MDEKKCYDIFISYSRRDKDIVDKIVRTLQNQGYSVWIDRDGIYSGEAFSGVIADAIINSKIVLFFSSKNSNVSRWTRKELCLALDVDKLIIPVKLDSTVYNTNIRLLLSDLEYVDLSDANSTEESISYLMRSIKKSLGIGRSTKGPAPGIPRKRRSSLYRFFMYRVFMRSWHSRNNLVNLFLIICFIGLIVGLIFSLSEALMYFPLILIGGLGLTELLLNKEDGIAWIVIACLLCTLINAYNTTPNMTRFFLESSFLFAWFPLGIACIFFGMMFLRNKKGKPWWKQCRRISSFGMVTLLVCGCLWIFLIIYDTYTKLGLPANLRYFIHKLFLIS